MRDIKFRAWDGKRMLDGFVPTPIIGTYSLKPSFRDLESGIETPYVMQYTGLKDKNGKEIYEGDILRYPANWLDPVDLQTFDLFHVIFNNGAFEMSDNKGERLWDWNDEAEIIGNVYENPELLNP